MSAVAAPSLAECSICLDTAAPITQLPVDLYKFGNALASPRCCRSTFHLPCFSQALRRTPSCSSCRNPNIAIAKASLMVATILQLDRNEPIGNRDARVAAYFRINLVAQTALFLSLPNKKRALFDALFGKDLSNHSDLLSEALTILKINLPERAPSSLPGWMQMNQEMIIDQVLSLLYPDQEISEAQLLELYQSLILVKPLMNASMNQSHMQALREAVFYDDVVALDPRLHASLLQEFNQLEASYNNYKETVEEPIALFKTSHPQYFTIENPEPLTAETAIDLLYEQIGIRETGLFFFELRSMKASISAEVQSISYPDNDHLLKGVVATLYRESRAYLLVRPSILRWLTICVAKGATFIQYWKEHVWPILKTALLVSFINGMLFQLIASILFFCFFCLL